MEFFPLREQKGAVMITSSSNQQMKNITALMKKAKEDCRAYKVYVALVCAGFTAFLVCYGFYRTNLPI